MSLPTLSASTLVLSPLKAAAFLLGSIAVAIVITGCSLAEPEKSETEKQASSAAVASSESQKAAVSSTKPESTTTETVQAPKTAMSPKETVIKMRTELENIKTYTDLEVFALKYMTRKGLATFQEHFNAFPEAEKVEEVSKLKEHLLLSSEKITTNIQENISGSTATLTTILGDDDEDDESFRLITLVQESNQWKVDLDNFKRLVEFSL